MCRQGRELATRLRYPYHSVRDCDGEDMEDAIADVMCCLRGICEPDTHSYQAQKGSHLRSDGVRVLGRACYGVAWKSLLFLT